MLSQEDPHSSIVLAAKLNLSDRTIRTYAEKLGFSRIIKFASGIGKDVKKNVKAMILTAGYRFMVGKTDSIPMSDFAQNPRLFCRAQNYRASSPRHESC